MASATAERLKLTYADLESMPEDGRRHEIIDGELFVTAAPNTRHQRVLMRLAFHLETIRRQLASGELFFAPLDVEFSDSDVVQPDLVYVARPNLGRLTERNLEGAPDLAVEVLSPATRRLDDATKFALYERGGVAEYWIVDPDAETIRVHRRESPASFGPALVLLAERGDALTSHLFPGLELPLRELFAA